MAVATFLFARKGQIWTATIAAMLASATRLAGLGVVLAYQIISLILLAGFVILFITGNWVS